MGEENYNLLISNTTEMNTNRLVEVNIKEVVASNKKANANSDSKYKAFFFNDVDLVSTENVKLATLTNNIVLFVLTQDMDNRPMCYVHYFYKITCHGWATKLPVHVSLFDEEGNKLKKINFREIEVYAGCKGLPDSRIEYVDPSLFNASTILNRGGDNSRWMKC